MKKQLIIAVFLACLLGKAAFGQEQIAIDARVELSPNGLPASTNEAGGFGQSSPGRSDTFTVTKRNRAGGSGLLSIKSLDRRLVAAVYRESARNHIDPWLVFSLIWQESGGKLYVISPKGARGPMQLMPQTAAKFGARNAFDPDQAVKAGVAYFVELLDEFDGNVSQALAGYNAGMVPVYAFLHGKRILLGNHKVVNPRGIKTAGGIPPYRETENYVESIANNYRRFRQADNSGSTSREIEK